MAVTPDGKTVFVTDFFNDGSGNAYVSTIDVATRTKDPDEITPDASPIAVAITPDGVQAYTANLDGGDVTTIDVATRTAPDQDVPVGSAPADVAFTPCGPAPPPPAPTPVVITPRFTG